MIFMFCDLCVITSKFSILLLSDPLHPRGLRCPLILQCGHTVCENCIRTCLRSTDKVVCGICKRSSTASHQHTDIRLDFPLNIYLLGVFAARYWGSKPEDSVVTFAASSGSSSNRKASALKGM
jgi:RING-finger-containing E3 ubiquitin ligase